MANNKYHQRVFVLNYDEQSLPKFETQAEVDEFHKTVGRMICYGLAREAETDRVDVVVGSLGRNPVELCCAYHQWQEGFLRYADGTHRYTGSPFDAVHQFVDRMKGERPFVMAAVQHHDGKFGFHS